MPSTVLQDYEVVTTIGSGSYGTCQKIKRKKDGKILVWKALDYGTMTEVEKSMLVSEVNLLRELKHKYIVRYYDRIVDRSTSKLYIIMEFCEGGDLAGFISKMKKEGRHTEECFVWKICYQIISALKECHCRNKNGKAILHRDLKPANVFLDSSKDVKLGDFGLARVLNHDTSFAKTFVGTPYYMSPEQMNLLSYNEKSDVWSLGCLLYELCVYRPPFTGSSQRELASKICGGHFLRLPLRYSDELSELITYMLQVDESKRPTIEKLSEHPLVLKHTPASPRASLGSGDTYSQKLESLRCREMRAIDKEALVNEKEATVNDLLNSVKEQEKSLKDREKLLKEREKILKKKEKDLEVREKALTLREKLVEEPCAKSKGTLENLHKSSPRPSLEPSKYNYSPREPGEVFPLADSGIHSPCGLVSPRDGKENRPDTSTLLHSERLGSASSIENLLADYDRRKGTKSLSRKWSTGKLMSPSSKLMTPRSEKSPVTPKSFSGRHTRCPLQTIGDSNREMVTEMGRRGSYSPRGCGSSPGTPQVMLKSRVLKLFKKSPPGMFSEKGYSGIKPLLATKDV